MPQGIKLRWLGAQVKGKTRKVIATNVRKAAEYLKSQIQRSMKGGGGRSNVKRSVVQRSQPGQPPYVQTGHLRQSIFVRQGSTPESYKVGTNLDYGVALELGVRSHTIRPRFKKMLATSGLSRSQAEQLIAKYPNRVFPRIWKPKGGGKFVVLWGRQVTVQVKARPFIRPAVKANARQLEAIISDGRLLK